METISFLQGLGDWLLPVMYFFTSLGYESFYLVVMPLFYWCIDSLIGARLALMLVLTGGLNEILKLAFHAPRPSWVIPEVKVSHAETNFAMPSGHAQNAVGFWGLLAHSLGKTWIWIISILVAFLIGVSRLYLGVHFPRDVLVGWLVGALLLWLFIRLEAPIGDWVKRQPRWMQFAVSLAGSIIILLVGNLVLWTLRDWTIPQAWLENTAQDLAAPPDPLNRGPITTIAGFFFGLTSGLVLNDMKGGFSVKGPLVKRALRYILGMVGTLAFWSGLKAIFPSGEELLPQILRYVRYALTGFWVTGLAPMAFRALKLASRSKQT
jgi:membrane-associated phospholipid phosphatase